MWNFLIKLVKEFYKKMSFLTLWNKVAEKNIIIPVHNFKGNNLRIHKHSICPASFFQKWNQILQKDNCFNIKIAQNFCSA